MVLFPIFLSCPASFSFLFPLPISFPFLLPLLYLFSPPLSLLSVSFSPSFLPRLYVPLSPFFLRNNRPFQDSFCVSLCSPLSLYLFLLVCFFLLFSMSLHGKMCCLSGHLCLSLTLALCLYRLMVKCTVNLSLSLALCLNRLMVKCAVHLSLSVALSFSCSLSLYRVMVKFPIWRRIPIIWGLPKPHSSYWSRHEWPSWPCHAASS